MLEDFLPRAPITVSSKIIELCKSLVPTEMPRPLNVEIVAGMKINDCYGNVSKMISENGGSRQLGWQIWESLSGLIIEAEFHAVWVDPNGAYHDVTPKELSSINHILFLPDNGRFYNGHQIDTVRIASSDDSLLAEYIENEKEYFRLVNEGDLANWHGTFAAAPGSQVDTTLQRRQQLIFSIIEKYDTNSDFG